MMGGVRDGHKISHFENWPLRTGAPQQWPAAGGNFAPSPKRPDARACRPATATLSLPPPQQAPSSTRSSGCSWAVRLCSCAVPYRGAAGDSDAVAACRAAGSARGTWVRASPPGPAGACGRPHLHRAASCAPHRALTARGDRVLAPLISARLRSRTARVLQSAPADTGTAGPASLAGAPVRTAAYSPNPSSLHGAKQVCGVRMCVRA